MLFISTLLTFCAVSKTLWAWLPYRIDQTCREENTSLKILHFQSLAADWGLSGLKANLIGTLPILGPLYLLKSKSSMNNYKALLHLGHDLIAIAAVYFIAFLAPQTSGLPPTYLVAIALGFLITLSFIDIEHHLLPNALTYPLIGLGILVSFQFESYTSIEQSIAGALIGYLSLWAVDRLYERFTGQYAIGGGDVKLFGAMGAWFGFSMLPIALGIACFIFLLVYSTRLLIAKASKGSVELYSSFGQYLCISFAIVLIYYFDIILNLP